jgi:hypothetical protein
MSHRIQVDPGKYKLELVAAQKNLGNAFLKRWHLKCSCLKALV